MRIWILFISSLLLSACSSPDRQTVDKLNSKSYACHYRNVDSTEYYAKKAFDLSEGYDKGRAEALNNLAFVNIVRMRYSDAEKYLNEIVEITDNQIQLLVAYVQQMRLCQRRSRNREFHEYRELADRALRRINEERNALTVRDAGNLLYAETEYAIVNSTYYYYVGLERQSIDALNAIDANEVQRDTAQYLNYLYNIGAGGIITEGTQQDINQQEFDHLIRCFMIARKGGYPYFAANALEALSEHLMDENYRRQLIDDNMPTMKFLNPDGIEEDMIPGWLAEGALGIFSEFGDVYQIAGAYRTLASCFRQIGDFESALYNLEQALSDPIINQAPDLVASIREQLSVAYSAMDNKEQSDVNRNIYIDLMTDTRQDRQLEARASLLESSAKQLNWMLIAVGGAIVLLLFSLWLFNHLNKKQRQHNQLDDLLEQRQDELAMGRLRVETSERRNLEQRARISLVNSVTPFIDRIIHEVDKGGDMEYVGELISQINVYNDILTQWIQLRQGELNVKVESFALQPLFDLVAKGRKSFEMKGISLEVKETNAQVKADRVLTLFMLNTLTDNARKFTAPGGRVELSATVTPDYVEISVSDTGQGMTEEQLAHLFDAKPISNASSTLPASHGFGLLNCKGIIEKYRKLSNIFSVCRISAESTLSKGSRLYFRLPKGIMRVLVLLSLLCSNPSFGNASDALGKAAVYADSAFFSNINGTYEKTLLFADSCRYFLNLHYQKIRPGGKLLLQKLGNPSLTAPEISWFHDSLDVNYQVVLDMRNESAVAALALHEWQVYSYNNKIYTQLYKELSADNTLPAYCRQMQQSQANKSIAVILLVLLLLSIPPAYYLLYYRHRLYYRFLMEKEKRSNLEITDDELKRAELENNKLHVANAVLDNCLSTLKHETMYYPSRIAQLIEQGDIGSLSEVVGYYRELYGILSQQAMHQLEGVRMHIHPQENGILGDRNLISYLFEILRKEGGGKVSVSLKDKYADVTVTMPKLHLSDEEARLLFTPASAKNIPYLLCRQIVRDHGEATNRRMCGISAENIDGMTIVKIILPAVVTNIKQ